MVLFGVLGTGISAYRALRRQWFLAVGSLLGTCSAELGYTSIVTHQSWLATAATAIAVGGSSVLWILMRRAARSADEQQPG